MAQWSSTSLAYAGAWVWCLGWGQVKDPEERKGMGRKRQRGKIRILNV